MSIRLVNPCYEECISLELRNRMLTIQRRCVECGSPMFLEIHHRVFRSQYTEEYMKQFLKERSKVFGKELWWNLHSGQNLVVLCQKCHGELHDGKKRLAEKYRESFTDIANGRNIFYDKRDYEQY